MLVVERLREEFGGELKFAPNAFIERFLLKHEIGVNSANFLTLEAYFARHKIYRSIFKRLRQGGIASGSVGREFTAAEAVERVDTSRLTAEPVAGNSGNGVAKWDSERFVRALRIKDYSRATVKSYVSVLDKFVMWLGGRVNSLSLATDELVFQYADELVGQKRVTSTYLRVFKAALHSYFSEVEGVPRLLPMLAGIRKRHALPSILTKGEVTRLLAVTQNLKHRAMLAVMYGSGLRVSEVVKLRIEDINFDNLTLRVRMAKGKKDRYSVFSESIIGALHELSAGREGKEPLFWSNQRSGKAVSARTLQNVFAQAKRKAGITKKVSCHSMRHSFATHLLEGGTDLRVIQKLLGHKHIQTTTIYTGVARRTLQNVKSPL